MSEFDAIPSHVRRFLLTSVPSVPYLEAALLFFRAPELHRNLDEAATALYVAPAAAQQLLRELCADGVLAREADGAYRYAGGAEMSALLADVDASYQRHLIAMTRLIHDTHHQHAMRFADAFRWRRKD